MQLVFVNGCNCLFQWWVDWTCLVLGVLTIFSCFAFKTAALSRSLHSVQYSTKRPTDWHTSDSSARSFVERKPASSNRFGADQIREATATLHVTFGQRFYRLLVGLWGLQKEQACYDHTGACQLQNCNASKKNTEKLCTEIFHRGWFCRRPNPQAIINKDGNNLDQNRATPSVVISENWAALCAKAFRMNSIKPMGAILSLLCLSSPGPGPRSFLSTPTWRVVL